MPGLANRPQRHRRHRFVKPVSGPFSENDQNAAASGKDFNHRIIAGQKQFAETFLVSGEFKRYVRHQNEISVIYRIRLAPLRTVA
jgi:hypothetical protein